jgi:hypothetical protein
MRPAISVDIDASAAPSTTSVAKTAVPSIAKGSVQTSRFSLSSLGSLGQYLLVLFASFIV